VPESPQDRIDAAGGIPQYLNHSVTPLVYPYPPAYPNWRDEQRARLLYRYEIEGPSASAFCCHTGLATFWPGPGTAERAARV
jgi:hypothetical protein